STPAWAYGSIQDHGSRRGRVDLTNGRDRIPAVEWSGAPGGEGSHQAIDRDNPNVVYSHGFYGNFTREDTALTLRPRPAQTGAPAGGGGRGAREGVTNIRPPQKDDEAELRAQWMAPIIVSQHDGALYAGYQFVFRSITRGDSWEKISPDLTTNNAAEMLPRSSSAVPYQTVVALAESPSKPGLLYAGTDDGRLHVTQNGGREWNDLTAALPSKKWVSRVVPSQHAESTVYVTQRGREDDDFAAYMYKSTDGGRTFASIASNIPAGPVNVIQEDPVNPNILYAGTDFGAFVSDDGGKGWQVLGSNLPSVQVSDLQYQARDHVIVISTYGRGMYALDAMKVRAPK
ncbi:MAG: hypothetical protein LC753_15475, partial [Acidobacteria bacterium]|nr:hypothetical protein [Acidobacteriota bacterium]